MMKQIILLTLFGAAAATGSAQDWFFNQGDVGKDSIAQKSFIQLRYQIGKISDAKTDAINYIEANPFQSVDIRYGIYGYGRKKWHQLHDFPTYGLGVGKFLFQPRDNIVGNPVTTYLFFNEPLIRFKRASLGYDFSMGLAYNWKSYNSMTNPDQLVIGSAVTGLLGLSFQYDFKLSPRFDGTLGTGVIHFSNGRIRSPNRGLNLYALNASLRYRLGSRRPDEAHDRSSFLEPTPVRYKSEPFHPFYEYYFVLSAGLVTTFQDRDNPDLYYLAGSLSADVARHYGYKGKYGFGFDWSYDESLKEVYQNQYPGGVPNSLLYWSGLHLSHEYMIHRWTFITQAGINLKVVGDKGTGYGRIAFRYDVSKRVFVRIGLRVYKTIVSDFMEWGVGYAAYRRRV